MKHREKYYVGAGMAAALVICAHAHAADLPPPEPVESPWQFTVAPYLWAAGLDGDVGAFGADPVEVDLSFGDVFDALKFGAMGISEIRYGRFGLVSDLIYVKLETDFDRPLVGDVELSATTFAFTGLAEYRLMEAETFSFDAMAGVRVWDVSNELSFDGGVILDGLSFDDDETWVDPMIGVKGRAEVSEHIFLTGWGLIGGFGVSSDFAWDAMGGLGYAFNDAVSLVAGYRGLGVDYRNDGFVFDVVQHGPIFGAVFRF